LKEKKQCQSESGHNFIKMQQKVWAELKKYGIKCQVEIIKNCQQLPATASNCQQLPATAWDC
jgi:hypothetical protein